MTNSNWQSDMWACQQWHVKWYWIGLLLKCTCIKLIVNQYYKPYIVLKYYIIDFKKAYFYNYSFIALLFKRLFFLSYSLVKLKFDLSQYILQILQSGINFQMHNVYTDLTIRSYIRYRPIIIIELFGPDWHVSKGTYI